MVTPDKKPDLQTVLRPRSSVTARQLGEEMILLDLDTGVYFGLNQVGAEIWLGISRGDSLEEVVGDIMSKYEVERSRSASDVLELAAKLLDRGLVDRD